MEGAELDREPRGQAGLVACVERADSRADEQHTRTQQGSGGLAARTVGVVPEEWHGLLAQLELLQFESGEPVPEAAVNGACEGSEAEESSTRYLGSHIYRSRVYTNTNQ